MEPQPEKTKVSRFLSSLLPEVDVNTQVEVNTRNLMETAAIIFVAAVLIILAFFAFKKL